MPETPKKVQLFHTCIINQGYPEVGLSVVAILERLGVEVEVPLAQTCCGQPAFNGGFHADARAVARHAVDVLARTEDPIVIPSGSCADMMVHQYHLLFEDDGAYRDKAHAVSARCHEFSQFLVDVLQVADLKARLAAGPSSRPHSGAPTGSTGAPSAGTSARQSLGAPPRKVAYHPSCHLMRGMGVKHQPRLLLDEAEGIECRPVKDQEECCGFGGLFSVKNAAISTAMLENKIRNLEASGAETVVSCDMGCLMHLEGGLRRRGSSLKVQHLSQALLAGAPALPDGRP